MPNQVPIGMTGLDKAILNHQKGWDSIRMGRAFDYENCTMIYERGRQFAIAVKQVLGFIPPLTSANLELLRPIYLTLRLDQIITGDTKGLVMYAGEDGRFSPARYAQKWLPTPTTAASSIDSLLGF